ncbi:MAG TPA: RNA-binding protein [archaeon]|jgi:small nuclear ribonucleoprotein|nr:RNA-binding protein [archaeon]HPC09896.1 RNA-binding protein [archaeon]HRT02384.1 RNA-binding protein [Candidatus Diapherotrites archaeon]
MEQELKITRPFDMLNNALNKQVLVFLKDNIQVRGLLKSFDVHMNIVLEDAEELKDGKSKTKYIEILLRGDNIVWIAV